MIAQYVVLSLFLGSSIITLFLILKRPFIQLRIRGRNLKLETYILGALLGPILIILFGLLTYEQIIRGLGGVQQLNPFGILLLFLSMVFMSIFLDITGFFEYCARLALVYAGKDGRRLFLSLYVTISILTIFTSNDIIILTFTPFIFYFARDAGINPKPYLIAEFFAANTWSMMLYIGNPTNIVVATAFRLHFDAFTKWMFLPTMAAGITSICLLYVVFQKEICVPFHTYPTTDPSAALTDKKGAGMGLGLMGGCILALALAPYVDLELWVISLIFALSLLVILVIREFSQKKWTKHELNSQNNATIATLRRMPWGVVPFILSLFIMVEALNVYGITSEFSSILKGICGESAILYSLVFGALSATLANLLNNIPMTVAFVSIMEGLTGNNLLAAAFATTIGSNLGANITPFGSLAGIMWLSILTTKNFRITFREFAFYGLLITPVTLLASLGVLGLEFYFM